MRKRVLNNQQGPPNVQIRGNWTANQRIAMVQEARRYRWCMYIAGGLFLAFFITVLAISLTITVGSGAGAEGGRFFTPAPPVVMTTTTVNATTTTTTTTTVNTTTTPPATTTPAPLDPIVIVCQPDVTLVYGKPMDAGTINNELGGNTFTNVTGGCTTPVVTFMDETVGIVAKSEPDPLASKPTQDEQLFVIEANAYEMVLSEANTPIAERRKRSLFPKTPSWPNGTFIDSINEATTTFSVNQPNPSLAASDAFVVWTDGERANVADPNLTPVTSFAISSLGSGNCATGAGQSQVVYDQFADRWIFMEKAATPSTLCIYVSDTSNPVTASYTQFELLLPYAVVEYPRVGLWGTRVYSLSFSAYPEASPHCFLNREDMLTGFVPVNTSTFLCTNATLSNLSGFTFQTWTPVGMETGPLPVQTVEDLTTGKGGAVFMRLVDDELHFGASTSFDFIEVYHYQEVNFTTAALRVFTYSIAVGDYDSSLAGAIPQPSGPALTPYPQLLRAQFRYLPECGVPGTIVCAWVSHYNGVDTGRVYWAELRFALTPSLINRFGLYQQGTLNWMDGESRFAPSIGQTNNGTTLLLFGQSSSMTNPSLYMTSRAVNDPLGFVRTNALLNGGTGTSASSLWGRSYGVVGDEHRQFYGLGMVGDSGSNWSMKTHHIRVRGEIVERTYTAVDTCGQVETCVQTITLV